MDLQHIDLVHTKIEDCFKRIMDCKESAMNSREKTCSKQTKSLLNSAVSELKISISRQTYPRQIELLEELKDKVFDISGFTFEQLNVRSRKRALSLPRQVIMSVYFKLFASVTADEAASIFGRDHSVAFHSCKTIGNLIDTNITFKKQYSEVWDWAININPKFDVKSYKP